MQDRLKGVLDQAEKELNLSFCGDIVLNQFAYFHPFSTYVKYRQ